MEQSDPARRALDNTLTAIQAIQRRLESTRTELGELKDPPTLHVQAALDDAAARLSIASAQLRGVVMAIGKDPSGEGS